MTDYISLRIDTTPASDDISDLLAAFLADAGYESFEPDADGLTAYIKASDFNQQAVDTILADFPIPVDASVSHELVKGRDWNEEWEKNYFQPIVIEGECVVHSTFHTSVPAARYDIVIDPKMAFGTGHHATTSMMVRHLLKSDLQGRRLIDMGTGTGILAILAMIRGAESATGVEIDPDACTNARENVALNNVDVDIICGDASALDSLPPADYFLANINRNVILADIESYANALKSGGRLILSGFYEADVPMLLEVASRFGLVHEATLTQPGEAAATKPDHAEHGPWASLRLRKE